MSHDKAKQRVAVAKDVLERLAAEKFVPNPQRYLGFGGPAYNRAEIVQERAGQELAVLLELPLFSGKNCQACALGSLFMSQCRLYDEFSVSADTYGDGFNQDALLEHLTALFPPEQLTAIEVAYMGDVVGAYGRQASYVTARACAMVRRHAYPDNDERLRVIMRNIVNNGGTFDIEQYVENAPIPGALLSF